MIIKGMMHRCSTDEVSTEEQVRKYCGTEATAGAKPRAYPWNGTFYGMLPVLTAVCMCSGLMRSASRSRCANSAPQRRQLAPSRVHTPGMALSMACFRY